MSATNLEETYRTQTARIAELEATLNAVRAANERAAKRWQAAHPGKELVIPDQAKMVEWLLEQNAALRADKARLDWLGSHQGLIEHWEGEWYCAGEMFTNLRAAVDAARKEAKP